MKIIVRKRGDLPLLRKALEYATIVQPDPVADNPEAVRRFKYAAGKNWNHLTDACKDTDRKREHLARRFLTAQLVDLHEALLAAVTPLAAIGKDGPQIEDGDLPGFIEVIPAIGKEAELSAAVAQVEADHADAVALRAQLKSELDVLAEEMVAINIHMAEWSALPSKLAGGTMALIEFMLIGVPACLSAVEVRPSVRAAITRLGALSIREVNDAGSNSEIDTALLILEAYEYGREIPTNDQQPEEATDKPAPLSIVPDTPPASS